jgi:hypothetical protein
LELICRRQNVQALTVGALSGDEALEVIAVSWIWNSNEMKNIARSYSYRFKIKILKGRFV